MKIHSSRRGFALLVTLFFMILFSMLGFAYLNLVPFELQAARHQVTRDKASLMAQAAMQGTWNWIRWKEENSNNSSANPASDLDVSTNPNATDVNWPKYYDLNSSNNSAKIPGLITAPINSDGSIDSDWSCKIKLYPDIPTLNGDSIHSFRIAVTAAYRNKDLYAAEYIIRQETFAKYGFFVDKLPNGGYYSADKDDNYSGEFHINGPMPLKSNNNLYSSSYSYPDKAVFQGTLSFSQSTNNAGNDGIKYISGSALPFNGSGVEQFDAGIGRYSRLFRNGKSDIKIGAEVPLPSAKVDSSNNLLDPAYAKAAWFGRNLSSDNLSTATIKTGLNIRQQDGVLSGLYIKGDVRSIDMKVVDNLGNNVARDGDGKITTGNSRMAILNETNAADPGKAIEVTELSSYSMTIPSGVKIQYNSGTPGAVTSGPTNIAVDHTVVKRPAGTAQNLGPEDVYEVWDSIPKGVVYVDGNIGKVDKLTTKVQADLNNDTLSESDRDTYTSSGDSLGGISGINYGQARTIAVNVNTKRYLRIKGDITRADTNPATPNVLPTTKRDGLGLVGYDIVLGKENAVASATPFTLYSLLMAGGRDKNGVNLPGSVLYENIGSTGGTRVMNSIGSYVVGRDRYWWNGNGYNPSFKHDTLLANSPPPFYPTRYEYKLIASSEVKL